MARFAVLSLLYRAEGSADPAEAAGAPVSAGQVATAAGLSASYVRALVAQFRARPVAVTLGNGHPRSQPARVTVDLEASP